MNSDEQQSTLFTIFGFTGDLAVKKIIPSLWYLFREKKLPKQFHIIGFARRPLSQDDVNNFIRDSISSHATAELSNDDFQTFCNLFSYVQGDFNELSSYLALKEHLFELADDLERGTNTLYYLSVPPEHYAAIFDNASLAGLNSSAELNQKTEANQAWTRILIEKPFGTNLKTATDLQQLVSNHYTEEQIFRIDHYLFKEVIQGIENFRFSNNLFEDTWDNTTIESIELKLLEEFGPETRGAFYDSVGALKDVGQNHLLSMLSILTMDYPLDNLTDSLRANRAKVIETLAPFSTQEIKQHTYRSQYQGYLDVAGVKSGSDTETYFKLTTELQHPKWKGVPITIEAGKKLQETRKEIIVTLKHPKICHLCEIDRHEPNKIIFRMEPNDEVVISFWTKKPGLENALEKRSFSFFLYEKKVKKQYVEEYAKVIFSALNGDQTLFLSDQEVQAMWKFTDPIVHGWKQNLVPLETYESGSTPKSDLLSQLTKTIDTQTKEIGIIGLGKMGEGLALQLVDKGWTVVGNNRSPEVTERLSKQGVLASYSLKELVSKLSGPKTVWLMVPHQTVDEVLDRLIPLLSAGDTVIDGGNSHFKASIERFQKLAQSQINFLDVGVSGGPDGARNGTCSMIGGDKTVFEQHEQIFKDISVPKGYAYVGRSGAGHFVKMVHNGIEYGMMQSIAEGFEVLKKSDFSLDLLTVSNLYNHGSVITSSLVGWLAAAYEKFSPELSTDECCSETVGHSGEGQWTVDFANEIGVPVTVIQEALAFRKRSSENPSYTGRVLSALRHEFGGHSSKM